MKKFTKAIAILLSIVCTISMATACKPKSQGIDETKVQLYIGNYDGGVGSRWLYKARDDFQKLYEDTEFVVNGEVKTGVEVIIDSDKVLYDGGQIKNGIKMSPINLYFTERSSYYSLVRDGLLYDITEGVTKTLDNGEKSIAEKMNASLNEYFCVDDKYYGVSHYETYRGIVYDIDLFDLKGLYMVQTNDGSMKIGGKLGATNLTAGPDGKIETTYDNGLPATYEEFFWWCKYVNTYKGVTPICWNGTDKESYTGHLINALWADAQGKTEADYLYTKTAFDDVYADTVTVSAGNAPVISKTKINARKDLLKTKGYYYSADFLKKILENNYYYGKSMNITQSNELTQYDFLHSRFESDTRPIAMMVEGTWWEEEANSLFEDMEGSYDNAGRTQRKLGFMPLPKIDKNHLGAPTLFDGNQSVAFVNGNCDELHADLAVKFLRFISTEEKLQEFNTITGLGRDYEYKLTDEQYAGLSAYAKSIYDVSNSADIVYAQTRPYATWLWTQNNPVSTASKITVDGNEIKYESAISALASAKITTEMYFNGINK